MRRHTGIAIGMAAALGLAGCGSTESASGSDGLEIGGVWARATAPGASSGATYMSIESVDGDRLVSVSVGTDIAGEAQIHEVKMMEAPEGGMEETDHEGMEDSDDMDEMDHEGMDHDDMDEMDHEGMDHENMESMMQMSQIDGLDLPAGESVTLAPGGYHIMLLELAGPLVEGESFEVCPTFETAGEICLDVPISAEAP